MSTPKKINVLFLRKLGSTIIDYIKNGLGDLPVDILYPADNDRERLMTLVPDADVLIGWGSDPELLEKAENLKLFINPGTGINQHLDHFRKHRETRDVVLVNGHGNSYAVAQHSVALLLSLANKVIPHHRRMSEACQMGGQFQTTYFKNITIGLLSYGAINSKVHRFLSGFDVTFAAFRRTWDGDSDSFPTEIAQFAGDQLGDFFEHCDVVINALPDTRFTRGMVTMDEFERLGDKGLFVNVGRADSVVEKDIYLALKDRVIAGAALDVWWPRGPKPETGRNDPYSYPFHELDNLVMSPHRGADSGGNLARWDEVIENVKRLHAGRTDFINVVDIDLEY